MYFRRYEDKTKQRARIERLFAQYQTLHIGPYTLGQIEARLEEKYAATEVCDPTYFGLIEDPMVDTTHIVKLYEIAKPHILNELFNDEERRVQRALAKESFVVETESEALCVKMMRGELLRLALESTDGIHLSGCTQQGDCQKIAAELFVVGSNVTPEDVDLTDEWFQEYLEALVLAGYMQDV